MGSLYNGNDIILDKGAIKDALVAKKSKLSIDFAKITYFAEVFIKEAGSKSSISRFSIKPIVRSVCNKCGILGKDPEVIEKILKG